MHRSPKLRGHLQERLYVCSDQASSIINVTLRAVDASCQGPLGRKAEVGCLVQVAKVACKRARGWKSFYLILFQLRSSPINLIDWI